MQIVQATFGVFHQFELAQQLYQRHLLRKIYSTWPWARLKREGLPRSVVSTFPLIHTADTLLIGKSFYPKLLAQKMKQWTSSSFDEWLLRVMPECDALIALSGAALKTGALVQRRGGKYICDRGSSHHRFQVQIIDEEHDRWGLPRPEEAPGVVERDEEIYALADAITAASSFSARTYVRMGVPSEKIHIIPYGVRLEHFKRSTPPPDIREQFEVIFAGQVSLRKGIPYLLEAFARVRHPHKRLRIMGNAAPGFREFLGRLPLEGVEFVGSVPQAELAAIMGSSHVLVLPSIEDGFGLVMNQAMACGCPVIASTNTGGEDLFSDGEQGFIVPVRDPAALADRMQRLVDEPELQRKFSEAATGLIHTFGGWEQYGDRWEALLHSLTGK
jgi:glycosyltransferase involved in cell wall biosynthesis